MSKANASTAAAVFSPAICSITAACPNSLSQASVNVSVNRNTLSALIDTGSSDSFISQTVAEQLNLKIHPSKQDISMALTSLKTHVIGQCFADIDLNQHVYTCTRLGVLKDLCSDIILGHDFQKEHERVTIEFGGSKPELIIPNSASVCAVSAATIDEPSVFSQFLTASLSPVNPGVSAMMTRISFDKKFLSFSPRVLLWSVRRLGVHKWLWRKTHWIGTKRDFA